MKILKYLFITLFILINGIYFLGIVSIGMGCGYGCDVPNGLFFQLVVGVTMLAIGIALLRVITKFTAPDANVNVQKILQIVLYGLMIFEMLLVIILSTSGKTIWKSVVTFPGNYGSMVCSLSLNSDDCYMYFGMEKQDPALCMNVGSNLYSGSTIYGDFKKDGYSGCVVEMVIHTDLFTNRNLSSNFCNQIDVTYPELITFCQKRNSSTSQ